MKPETLMTLVVGGVVGWGVWFFLLKGPDPTPEAQPGTVLPPVPNPLPGVLPTVVNPSSLPYPDLKPGDRIIVRGSSVGLPANLFPPDQVQALSFEEDAQAVVTTAAPGVDPIVVMFNDPRLIGLSGVPIVLRRSAIVADVKAQP